MSEIGGFMICKAAKSSPYACENCRQRVELSVYGKMRMREVEKTGKRLAILCNSCGRSAMTTLKEAAAADPEHPGADLEILPNALDAIADTDPEFAKELFRKDAARREQEAKDKKP